MQALHYVTRMLLQDQIVVKEIPGEPLSGLVED